MSYSLCIIKKGLKAFMKCDGCKVYILLRSKTVSLKDVEVVVYDSDELSDAMKDYQDFCNGKEYKSGVFYVAEKG